MGCLWELIFEFVFEVMIELVGTIYIKLMTLLIPDHSFSNRLRERIKKGVTVFAALLFLCALFGFFLFLQPPSVAKTVGAYMLFIPLGITSIQILAGIVYQIIKVVKKRR